MSDTPSEIDGTADHEALGHDIASPHKAEHRRAPRVLAIVVALLLVGGGVGAAVALSSSSSGPSSPSSAVDSLLASANHSDLLGALAVIAPGERNAIEPGLTELVNQLIRLHVLSSNAHLGNVSGISLHFSGVHTKTEMLTSDLAAVRITSGSVTTSVSGKQLPLGSFVDHLASGVLGSYAKTQTSSAKTGRAAIVTEKVNGTWYVSIGNTIAVDELRSSGQNGAPPPVSQEVEAVGSATAEGAVRTLLLDAASFNLRGIIADLPPGEMGALQAYAPLFLGKANTSIERAREAVKLKVTNMALSGTSVAGGTLVHVGALGLSATLRGVTIGYQGGCVTIATQNGTTIRKCPTKSEMSALSKQALSALPSPLRRMVLRLGKSHPSSGFLVVNEGGRWFVSPTATLFDDVNGYLGIFEPQDLTAIAGLAENRAEWQGILRNLEQIGLRDLKSSIAEL